MGQFFPCLTAAVLNGCALQIFREPMKVGNGPLMALYMFIFSMFILLWSICLYPRNLRRIGKFQFVVEFLAAEFLMEDLVIDFWFPLEKWILDSLPVLAQNIEEWLSAGDWSAEFLTDFLKGESCGFYVSYAMASFFLIATLQASRVIDLRTLTQEGPKCFFKEIIHKAKFTARRILRKFGIGKRKVKINELKNTHQNYCARLPAIKFPSRNCGPSNCIRKRNMKGKHKQFCPLHNPYDNDESEGSGFGDFEDLGALSDSSYK